MHHHVLIHQCAADTLILILRGCGDDRVIGDDVNVSNVGSAGGVRGDEVFSWREGKPADWRTDADGEAGVAIAVPAN